MSGSKRALSIVASLLLAAVAARAQSPRAEERVLDYVQQHARPGQPLRVSDLYQHFTQPAERAEIGKLYNAFFRIPLFLAQYQQRFGKPPSLSAISQQFDLHSPHAAAVLLRVMESDPRVPRFITRDPKTGEITHVDVEKIQSDPRFVDTASHELSGWEGRAAPPFRLERLGGGEMDSAALRGKVYLLYVWFTGCPPCMAETPQLVSLERRFSNDGFQIVGANADRLLKLGYKDRIREQYAKRLKINFPIVTWTSASNQAYGGVAIFPTIFLVNRQGRIAAHWVGFTSGNQIERAVAAATGKARP